MTERRDGCRRGRPSWSCSSPGRTSRTIRAGPTTSSRARPGAILVIISGPSGVGKDTIIDDDAPREVEAGRVGERHYVVTMTTRAPRDGEVDGVDYHFVSREEFLRIRADRGFLEANEVHGNWYGSPREPGPDRAAGRAVT